MRSATSTTLSRGSRGGHGVAPAAAASVNSHRGLLARRLLPGRTLDNPGPEQLAPAHRSGQRAPGSRALHACRAAADERPMSHTSSRAEHTPMAFHEHDFHRVHLCCAPYGPMKLFEDRGTFNGVLVFKHENDTRSSDDQDVLEVFVAGDTAYNTWSLLTHRVSDRPMVHELMWTLLERAQHGGDASNWALLRVAIVELRENVFIGRLFFGDKETGEVLWDCDCRPSDGVYLSLRSDCPFYVHRRVWDQAAIPVRSSSVYKLVAASTPSAASSSSSAASTAPPNTTTTASSSSSSAASPSTTATSAAPSYPDYVVKSGSPGGSFDRDDDDDNNDAGRSAGGRPAGAAAAVGGRGGRGEGEWQGKAANPLATAESLTMEDVTLIRPDDPDAIKLLKRQLLVAVAEEDYREAARLRDHAWMHLYRDMHVLRLRGRYEDAHRVEMELKRQIEAVVSATEH